MYDTQLYRLFFNERLSINFDIAVLSDWIYFISANRANNFELHFYTIVLKHRRHLQHVLYSKQKYNAVTYDIYFLPNKKPLTLYFVLGHTSMNVFLPKKGDTDLFLKTNMIGWRNVKRKQD